MSDSSFFSKCARARVIGRLPRWVGALVGFFGLLVMVSWRMHWRQILQMSASSTPMQFNTAICFTLLGAALYLLTTHRASLARWCGVGAFAIGAITLAEYLCGRNLGIDQLFSKPYLTIAFSHPGRMSPLTASSLILISAGMILAGSNKNWKQRLTGAGLLACMVAVIAFVALFGYALGIESAYGWGAYAKMAINTAGVFFLLGIGLLLWAWHAARAVNFNFLRWLPVTGSVTLMIMIAFVAAMNMAELKRATFWRKHTFDVILAAQAFEENLIDMQRGVRGYMTVGDTNALASFKASARLEPTKLQTLLTLVADNPAQLKRLQALTAAMDKVFAYDQRTITICTTQGFDAALKTDTNGVSRAVFGDARDVVKAFSQEEQRLLNVRETSEQADSNNAERLLIFGSVLAALLLVTANLMASRELRNRHKAEAQLREISLLQNAISKSANYAIIALDRNGIVKSFNPSAERMLGYSASEVIGKVTPMLWRDAGEVVVQAEKMSAELGQSIKPGIEILLHRSIQTKADEYEVTYVRKDGTRFPVFVSLTALSDEAGEVTGFLGIISDITDRKKSEVALRESEERFRGAFDDAPIGIALVDPNGRWLKVNRALCAMIGYTAPELLATDFQHITHPEDLEMDLDCVRQVLSGALPSYQMEKRYLHKNGMIVFVMLSVSLVRDHAGQPLYFISQVENITERKSQEAQSEKMIVELQSVISQVKTLSGLIPICGWCKSVRSDTGYWQTVEQYVHARTDATFSHGMCPKCAEKFRDDIIKNGIIPLPAEKV